MLEVLQFIFSEWYIFFGTLLLITVSGEAISDIVVSLKTNYRKENDNARHNNVCK